MYIVCLAADNMSSIQELVQLVLYNTELSASSGATKEHIPKQDHLLTEHISWPAQQFLL